MSSGGVGVNEWRTEGRQGGSLRPAAAHALDHYVPRKPPAARWVRGSPWTDVLPLEVVRRGGERWW
jgi:hypothetical protein